MDFFYTLQTTNNKFSMTELVQNALISTQRGSNIYVKSHATYLSQEQV